MPGIPAVVVCAHLRGTIKDGATLGGTRLGGIYRMPGGELSKVGEATEGDVIRAGTVGWRTDWLHGPRRLEPLNNCLP